MNQQRAREIFSSFFPDIVSAIHCAHRTLLKIRHADLHSHSDSFSRRDIAFAEIERRLTPKGVRCERQGVRITLRYDGVVIRFRKLDSNGEPSGGLFKPEQTYLPYHDGDELILGFILSRDRMRIEDIRLQRRAISVRSGQSIVDWEFSILDYAESETLPLMEADEPTASRATESRPEFEPKRRAAIDENEAN